MNIKKLYYNNLSTESIDQQLDCLKELSPKKYWLKDKTTTGQTGMMEREKIC